MDFKFCKWKVDKLQEEIDKLEVRLNNPDVVAIIGKNLERVNYLKGMQAVWKEFMYASCNHDFEEQENNDYKIFKCKHCGLIDGLEYNRVSQSPTT